MTYIQQFIKRLDVRLILIIISLLAVAWLQAPRLADEFRVDEDFRTFYWMHKFQDPSLFPNYSLGYTTIRLPWADVPVTFYSLGYSLLFYGASFFVSPVLFSKIVPFFLAPVTVLYLFEFGRLARGRNSGIVLVLGFIFFNLASSSGISIVNGLQRSFATPLVIALIYYLHRQKYIAAAVVILLSALIFAPVFALGVAIWGVFALKANWSLHPKLSLGQGGLGALFIVICLGALLLLPIPLSQIRSVATTVKPAATGQQEQTSEAASTSQYLWDNPAHRSGGSHPLFVIFPLVGRGGLVDLGEDLINLFILFSIGCLIYLVRGGQAFDLPRIIWCMLGAALLMFVLSWLVIWLLGSNFLYWPSRYTRIGLFLFLLMFVFLNMIDAVKEAPTLIRRHPQRLIWLIAGIEMLVLGLAVWYPSEWTMIGRFNMKWLLVPAGLACGILGIAVIRKSQRSTANVTGLGQSRTIESGLRQTFAGQILMGAGSALFLFGWAVYAPIFTEVSYLNPAPHERALFEFLETLPKDVLIAGTPYALDSVPLFAKRKILFSCEQSGEATIVREALAAYYTANPQTLVDFCHTRQVDYLVIDRKTYAKAYLQQGQIFYEPYNQALMARISSQDTFILAAIPENDKLFQTENLFIVACEIFTETNKLP
ncbi:MAG: hypothetical protein JW953_04030 [Anaerolineae bacterium]|nr:hypothetical protein [Anaerolineae bacterium]